MGYLAANYCPTTNDEEFCVERLSRYYVGMLYAIVNHYFVDGGLHICQTMGQCEAAQNRKYTCEECVEGLEWVEAYIEDPIMVAEYVVYLEQNFCLSKLRTYIRFVPKSEAQHSPGGGHHDQDACKQLVVE